MAKSNVKAALVGFQGTGKTSVFNVLTGQSAEVGHGKKGSSNLGRINVPDPRVDALSAIYEPKKTTYAEIQFVDVVGSKEKSSGSGLDPAVVNLIRESDALVHVVRDFDNPMLDSDKNAAGDIGGFEDELVLTDLVQIEKRVARLKKEKRGPELELLERLAVSLEEGTPLSRVELHPEELQAMSGFGFLSLKPMLVVLNQSEDAIAKGPSTSVMEKAKERNLELIALCATVEAEISAMEPADQVEFLKDYGLSEPVRTRFIRAAYGLLDLISFLTVGEDEVRAWTVRRGTKAKAAAGKIHSDIERGFIRAEVTPSTDFLELKSEAKVKEAGKLRLEGKEYVVQDGDIMHIRHSS